MDDSNSFLKDSGASSKPESFHSFQGSVTLARICD